MREYFFLPNRAGSRFHRPGRSDLAIPYNGRMAGIGASSSLPNAPDEGSFAMRFADLRHGGLRGAGSALASRLRAGWMETRVTKVARVSARFSKSLARRRL